MTWNDCSAIPQFYNLLPYAFRLVPPLLNLGSPGTLHTCKHAQPDHTTYTNLGLILFRMLSDNHKESFSIWELWKLCAKQYRQKSSSWHTQNWRTQPDASGTIFRYWVLPRTANSIQQTQIILMSTHLTTNNLVQQQANKPQFHTRVSGRRVLNPPTVTFCAKFPQRGLLAVPLSAASRGFQDLGSTV